MVQIAANDGKSGLVILQTAWTEKPCAVTLQYTWGTGWFSTVCCLSLPLVPAISEVVSEESKCLDGKVLAQRTVGSVSSFGRVIVWFLEINKSYYLPHTPLPLFNKIVDIWLWSLRCFLCSLFFHNRIVSTALDPESSLSRLVSFTLSSRHSPVNYLLGAQCQVLCVLHRTVSDGTWNLKDSDCTTGKSFETQSG